MAIKIRSLKRRFRRPTRSTRLQYLLVTTAAAFLAERLARAAITQGWRATRQEEPPQDPERLDVSWGSALAWTAITGLVIALAGLAARRGATLGWQRYTGKRVPV